MREESYTTSLKLKIIIRRTIPITKDLSLYIHWPFCLAKCPYCDFNSHVTAQIEHNLWLKSYEKELEHFSAVINNNYIKTIFFGGGTPSLMEPFVVEGIINKIAKLGLVDSNTEITLEANPTSFETEKFKSFRLAGVNRVSIGVQSLREADLKVLGRQHDISQAIKTIETARNIFPKISFDLIYARTNQTLQDWQKELIEAMQLASGHISLYQLTIEKGTIFYKLFKEGNLTIPESDLAADMYEWTNSYLEANGYSRYEISNYAIPNHECKHNLTYWNYNNYLGIGPGAHSRITSRDNISKAIMMWHKPEKWLQTVNDLGSGIQSSIQLSQQEKIEEILMMGLRLQTGIELKKLEIQVNKKIEDIVDLKIVENLQKLNLLELNKNFLKLTNKGLMLHSYLVPRIIIMNKNPKLISRYNTFI